MTFDSIFSLLHWLWDVFWLYWQTLAENCFKNRSPELWDQVDGGLWLDRYQTCQNQNGQFSCFSSFACATAQSRALSCITGLFLDTTGADTLIWQHLLRQLRMFASPLLYSFMYRLRAYESLTIRMDHHMQHKLSRCGSGSIADHSSSFWSPTQGSLKPLMLF